MYIARYMPAAPDQKPEQFQSINRNEVIKWAQTVANRTGRTINIMLQTETQVDVVLPEKASIAVEKK